MTNIDHIGYEKNRLFSKIYDLFLRNMVGGHIKRATKPPPHT